jgi:tetratricopeptide (TPR) repeat protein
MLCGVGASLRRILLVVASVGGICGVASAAAYDDFARGISANLQGDTALAVTSFSAALAAGDLNPTLLPTAYRGRAIAYLREGECKSASGDLDEYIRLKPGDVQGLELRGDAHACAGELAAADADLSQVIALRPDRAAYWNRGRLRWRLKNFGAAADDFSQVVHLQPENSYAVLWLELSRARGGTLDPKVGARDIDQLDSRDWPAPLIKLFVGEAKQEDMAAAALRGDAKVVANQQCEANFYIAEWWLAQKDATSAKPLLEAAAQNCPKNFVEYDGARFELSVLK